MASSPNLSKLKAENEAKAEEERIRLEEQEKLQSGVSLKRSGSFVLGEFPGYDASWFSQLKWYCGYMLESQRFDAVIGVVILMNSITIGIESSLSVVGVLMSLEMAFEKSMDKARWKGLL